MLKIKNLSKKFVSQTVLCNINLEIKPNSITGLAGSSGSGKSTLLRCIQGLESIDSGTIEYNGPTGFVFQDFQLFQHMTVIENVMYAPSIQDATQNYQLQALDLLKKLKIADKAHQYPKQLSGGQKQRVALARSLIMKPKILLCDEPTSGLDVATITDIVELLQSVQQADTSMIIASHDLDFLTQIADRIIVLKNGTLIAEIEPKELRSSINELKKYYE